MVLRKYETGSNFEPLRSFRYSTHYFGKIVKITNERIFVTLNASFTDVEKCRSAMETIVANAHAAYGVDSHFWFQSDDGKSLFVIEQYKDKKALNQAVRRFTREIGRAHV